MSTKGGPVFTFSLPGGRLAPFLPVSYTTGDILGVSSLKCTASHCQRSTHILSYQTSYSFRAQIKKIISRQTLTCRQSAVVILCENCITWSLPGQPKIKFFLLSWKFMKRPQTKFHTDNMSDTKVIKSKNVKIYH